MEPSSQAATPRSASESNTTANPKLAAPKDKNCPFCHQAFTSSSLGRHLDLYIKPKNPKAPDGVHNVDEIRKLRGGITRRQARTSSVKQETSAPASATRPSFTGDESPVMVHSPGVDDDPLQPSRVRTTLNELHWHATGVINNLPPRPSPAPVPEARRDISRHVSKKVEMEQRHKASDEWETGKAAELALKEVLGSFKEASARVFTSGPFDFDPFSIGFPGLCLRILSPPSTLFSPSPFPSPDSWSINPPGRKQFEALVKLARDTCHTYYRLNHSVQNGASRSNSALSPMAQSPMPTLDLFDEKWRKLSDHLTEAWNHWQTLSREQQQESWQLEILRSYHRSNDALKNTQGELEAARLEVEQLKAAQWSSVNTPQYPQFPGHTPPATLHVGTDIVKQATARSPDPRNWDYDHLVEKWKAVVRDNKKAANGMAAQRSLSVASPQSIMLGSRNCTMDDPGVPVPIYPPQNGTGANANSNSLPQNGRTLAHVYSAPPTINGTADDDTADQMDGEGEDEDADGDAEEAPEEAALADQRQQQYQAQAQAQAHAQAQAQAQQAQQAWARQNMAQNRSQQRPQPQQRMAQNPQAQHMQMKNKRSSQAMGMSNQKPDHAASSSGMMPMEGIENSSDAFLGGSMSLGMGMNRQ
ncbi:hypothetical protein BU16DRAFT_562510 [Lophium mytilinum]|uniref:Uncharacterized protein n=1 Tax=Lophium mytilinum TaxID=390894 RepID=A0A6A6QSA1_9PEZI|nr:hypothetical protein BU16DRAFT_562510 [Lophium mytilinum]